MTAAHHYPSDLLAGRWQPRPKPAPQFLTAAKEALAARRRQP